MPRSPKKTKEKVNPKPKTDKQVMDGLGASFEDVMQALATPKSKVDK